ncbi:uncharacterized protein I303_103076 [Kwoniella dejecticola CBS 10117]|uniref:Uncharacterized protein n=1 Tax=Kwoniella dejecticola CBS 10117 TaxID=1296121 RepID=A0A1A6AAI4_9TREE|nr:uncharacterized protein I303_03096 [Kwoniella dejecticola CBS 10117]OBR87073.1 hypothetical protein I303_03096 [Kwoniella dejecticola CBS 10117]
MKTSTSFAILAVLATASTSFAAPLPHKNNGMDSLIDMGGKGHDRHDHIVDAAVKADVKMPKGGKHGHHARGDPLQITKSLAGAVGLPTADHLNAVGIKNGLKMGKTKNNGSPQLNPSKILNPNTITKTDKLGSALKPVKEDTGNVGQQLNHPNAGVVGQVGNTVDGILSPLEKNLLSRDLLSSLVGGLNNNVNNNINNNINSNVNSNINNYSPVGVVTKPVGSAAGGLGKTVGKITKLVEKDLLPALESEVSSLTNAKGNPVTGVVGQVTKPLGSGSGALPVHSPGVKSDLLNSSTKGGLTDLHNGPLGTNGGTVVSAEKTVGGVAAPVVHDIQSTPLKAVTGTVGKLPNTVTGLAKGVNVDPLANKVVHVNTESTLSGVQKTGDTTVNKTVNQGAVDQTVDKVNLSAFSGEGKDHRVNPHATDGTKDRTEKLVHDNTSNAKSTVKDTTGINTGKIDVSKNVKDDTKDLNLNKSATKVEKTGEKTVVKPADKAVDKVIPSAEHQKSTGSLVTANNENVNAKIVQTPGKSDKVAEKDSNSVTGSPSNSDNVNVKVAVPHQVNKEVHKTDKTVDNLDHDHKGTGKIIEKVKQVLHGSAAPSHSHSPSASASASASHKGAASASASASASGAANDVHHGGRPLLFIGYTNGLLGPTSTIASESGSVSATPIADAHFHSGSIQVNKENQKSSKLDLPLTSALHLPTPSASAKAKVEAAINKAITKPRQATITYGQKGEHVVACDGKAHGPNDMIDECIKADLLDFRPNQTEACPTDMQHDIQYGVTTDMLQGQSKESKEIQKYVRLCLTATAL